MANKFKMSGHTLKGPNQKASIGKNLQDYQIIDGVPVALSTKDYNKKLDEQGNQTIVGDVSTTNVPFKEGMLVSDKMTGQARIAAGGEGTGKYEFSEEGNLLNSVKDPDLLNPREMSDRQKATYRQTSKDNFIGVDNKELARYKDVEAQKLVNEQAEKESGNKTGPSKKMKFGRKKK